MSPPKGPRARAPRYVRTYARLVTRRMSERFFHPSHPGCRCASTEPAFLSASRRDATWKISIHATRGYPSDDAHSTTLCTHKQTKTKTKNKTKLHFRGKSDYARGRGKKRKKISSMCGPVCTLSHRRVKIQNTSIFAIRTVGHVEFCRRRARGACDRSIDRSRIEMISF